MPDWAAEVMEAPNGTGVDLVVDLVGAGSMEQMIQTTRFGGSIVLVGMLGEDPNLPINIATGILYKAITWVGQLGAGTKEMGDGLSAFLAEHQIHPQINQVFEFEEAAKAFKAAENLSAPGKIAVKV